MIYLKNNNDVQKVQIPINTGTEYENQPYRAEIKTITIDKAGTYEITPDKGYSDLSKVIVKVVL